MTSDTRSPSEIEHEIERERDGLAHTLNDLQDRFSVESIARQFSDQFRENGGEITRSVADAVKRNPVALAVTGIGLAWMIFGDKSGTSSHAYDRHDRAIRQDRNLDRLRDEARDKRTTTPSQYRDHADTAQPSYGSDQGRDIPAWARKMALENDTYRRGFAENRAGFENETSDRTASRDRSDATSAGAASKLAETGRGAASSMAAGASSAASAVGDTARSVAGGVSSAAESASDRLSDMRARLAEGTESFSEEARQRVIAARERALDAWHGVGDRTRRGREMTADLYDEHPLIAGALALAVGAAVAAALPRSQSEDRYFGQTRDDLFDEAERIFDEESRKVAKVAQAATDEAVKVAREVKSDADAAAPSAAQAVTDKAKEAGKRVADVATSEAENQKLGDVKT